MKNLPTKKDPLAVDKQAMSERLAAMRKALAPEAPAKDTRVLHLLCSATGRPFALVFTRANANEKYRIESIESGNGASSAPGAPCGKPDVKPQDFPVGDFDLARFGCPHCGHRTHGEIAEFFGCACGKLQCGARIRVVNGTTFGTCHDGCGRTAVLSRKMESFSGEKGEKKESRKALKAPDGLKRLPGPGRK